MHEAPFRNISSFFKFPSGAGTGARGLPEIALLGIPFDGGSSYRSGARFAPSAMRALSVIVRDAHNAVDMSALKQVHVYDAGDVDVVTNNAEKTLSRVEAFASSLPPATRIVAVGGDHTVTLGLLRSLARRSGPVAMLQFDAHDDLSPSFWDEPYFHGNWAQKAAEENLIVPGAWIRVGARRRGVCRHEGNPEIDVIDVDTVLSDRRRWLQSLAKLRGHPVYITLDLDVLDPSSAPAVGVPVPGGLMTRELIALLAGLHSLDVVGADIVEFIPSYDAGDMTGVAAAYLLHSLTGIVAQSASSTMG